MILGLDETGCICQHRSAIVLYGCLEVCYLAYPCFEVLIYEWIKALLRASLDHNHLLVEKFARWLRAICTIILARNTVTDRAKAIGYVEQALAVIEDHNDSDKV